MLNEFAVCQKVKFAFDFERVIDDIVFMCFFVGNDFLPHLPSLDIRDGALDFLFNVYKRILPSFGGFITSDGGRVNLLLVDRILEEVAAIEDKVFALRHRAEEQDRAKRQRRNDKDGARQSNDPNARNSAADQVANILEEEDDMKKYDAAGE